jgi:MoaA/NifB/PqqE/SkfB family radical SAM enzyme
MDQDKRQRYLRYPLSFIPWKTCNAECAHCITISGPKAREHLSIDVIKRCLKEAAELGIKGYQFSGGEPTLFLDKLLDLLEFGKALGMEAGITTNASFARNPERAYQVMRQLADAGLTAVRVSTDKFHDPFIPFERVLMAIEAGLACKLETSVEVILVRKDTNLGEVFKALQKYPAKILTGTLVPQGRAKSLPMGLFLTYSYHQIKQFCCPQASTVFVDSDGQTYFCCNYPRPAPGESLDTSAYVIGNVYEDSLETILERVDTNPVSRVLAERGPQGVIEWLESKFGEEKISRLFRSQQRYYGLCDFCHTILSHHQLIPLIREAVAEEAGAGIIGASLAETAGVAQASFSV